MTKNQSILRSSDSLPATVKDHSVSGENFSLQKNEELDYLKTIPQPEPRDLPKYYQSEKYISHTDSNSSLTEKIYQTVKKFMLKKKLSWIRNEKSQQGSLLDIGAGTGDFLKLAANDGWNVFGSEPSSQARALAKIKKLALEESTSSFPEESFDVITMWHVLEHVPNLEEQIAELRRLLKSDGLLVIAVPNFKSYDAIHYKEHWAAYDVPRHLYHFSRRSIRKIFPKKGFELLYSKPLLFDAYYVSLLSEQYKTGSSNFLKAFFVGTLSNIKARTSGEYSSIVYFLKKV